VCHTCAVFFVLGGIWPTTDNSQLVFFEICSLKRRRKPLPEFSMKSGFGRQLAITTIFDDLAGRVGQDRATAIFEALRRLTRPNLTALRAEYPRIVSEFPETYAFRGTNYNLMLAVFRQLVENQRPEFIDYLCSFVRRGGFTELNSGMTHYPNFQRTISDLPLVAEFCIRTGHLKEVIAATQQVKMPTVALALMMMELEELVGLNFNVLTQQELAALYESLKPLREVAEVQTYSARGSVGKMVPNPKYKSGYEKQGNQIIGSIDGLAAECQQASYF
jgi:hypothetical protein